MGFGICVAVISLMSAGYGSSHDYTITCGGQLRQYRLHLPTGYSKDKRVPLVLALHGRGGSGPSFEGTSGMSAVADENGFIVAYPTALGTPRQWVTDFAVDPGPTDTPFLAGLIDEIESKYPIDHKRVFCCGFSMGGFMSHQVGASLSHRIAAIAVAEGTIGIRNGSTERSIPAPADPVSVLIFHGKADDVVYYNGGPLANHPEWSFFSAKESVDFWVSHDQCAPSPAVSTLNGGNVVRRRYSGGQHGTDVVFYTIVNGKHHWPTVSNSGLDGKNIVWKFFANHPKP